jgi:hypothetical protein
MTTAYTSLLGLALPVTGELSGTWGDTVNDQITALLDSSIAGTTTITSDADVTLTTTTGAANTSRQAILLWTASGTVTRTITAPAQSKTYVVINKTGSTQSIKLVGVGPTTGVTIVANELAVCAWNGVDFVKVSTTATAASFSAGTTGFTPSTATTGAITLAGTLGTANGGTNLTTFTNSGIFFASSTSVIAQSANLTWNGTSLAVTGTVAVTGALTATLDSTFSSTASDLFPLFATATSGTASTLNTSNAKLLYKPSTGEFQASVPVALNGIVVNSQTVATSYTIGSGYSAMSAGPITLSGGVVVTVTSGSRWVVQ